MNSENIARGTTTVKQWRKLQVSLALLCGVALVVLVASIIVREWTPLSAQGSASTSSDVVSVDEVQAPAAAPSETTPDIAEAEAETEAEADAGTDTEAATPAEQPTDDADTQPASDQAAGNTEADAQPADDNAEQPEASAEPGTSYSYTAQPGDSYTALVRQAIASYAESRDITLSAPQVLAAEVALANAAGSPELEIGQTVSLTPEQIAQAVPALAPATSNDSDKQSSDNANDAADKPSDDNDYSFTAAAGSSYTLLARDAVQQHAKARDVELTPAQRVYAESRLTTSAGSPLLNVGQQVTIARSAVAAAVDDARQLGTSQQAAWQHYATLANL